MNLSRAKEIFSGLETRSQLTLVGGLVAVLATFFLLYGFATKPSYSTLASNLDPAETSQAEKALASAGVTYRVESGGTQIQVLSNQESQARVALAEKGVLNGGHVGFEIFDQSKLGATDFQQQVDYQRALEGEIARTIESIQGVQSAQVQLVLPDDTLFADEQSKASAAVLVSGGSGLDSSTVRGIANLVASSVKGLASDKVTITDETGALLWPTEGGAGSASAHTKLEADSLYASQVASQINALLTSTLGPGKAVARVHADLNVDQTTIDKVTYAKKGTPLQSNTSTETLKSQGGAAALPAGTKTNTPGSYAAGTNGNGNSNYNHKTDQTTFGVDKTIQRSVVAPGTVNKLDVALVVDNSVPAAQVAQLQKSVASLAGITPARGDTLAVSRIAFAKQEPATETKESPVASLMADPLALAKKVLLGLGALIFLFAMRRALKRREGEASVPEPTWLREIEGGMTVAELEAGPTMPALPSAEQERRDEVRATVEEIANNKPEAIAHQVSTWMKE